MSIMKCNRQDLIAALTTAARIADKRHTIPILGNVVIECAGRSVVTVRTSNCDLECRVRVRGAETARTFAFSVGVHNLLNMVKKAKSTTFTIEKIDTDTNTVSFLMGSLRIKLAMLPVDDFPSFSALAQQHPFSIATDDLLDALTRCAESMSTEETYYYLNGVLWRISKRHLVTVATDGHRLARRNLPAPKGSEKMPDMILPRQLVTELIRVCSAKDAAAVTKVYVCGDDPAKAVRIVFSVGDVRYESKLIDGVFPDYERAIPAHNDKTLVLDREATIDAISAVMSIKTAGAHPSVKLALNGTVKVVATCPENGVAEQTVPGKLLDEHGKPTVMDIGFNNRYLLSILGQMASDQVTVKLSDPGGPALFTGPDDKDALHVLMPMRV